MGIIQSAVNQSLTGTAFLLGQSELYRDVYARNKANREGEKKLAQLKEAKKASKEKIEQESNLGGLPFDENSGSAQNVYKDYEDKIKKTMPKYQSEFLSEEMNTEIRTAMQEDYDRMYGDDNRTSSSPQQDSDDLFSMLDKESLKGFEAEEKAKRSIGYKTAMLKESKERQKRMKEAIKNRKLDFTEFGGEGTN